MNSSAFPFLLLILAGAMNGSFTLPMKFTRRWAWENTWLVWTVAGLFVFPVTLTLLTVPALGDVYVQAGAGPIIRAAAFGAGWGASQVCLGLAVESIGMALTFSVVLGLSAAVGCLIPLVRLHSEAVLQRGGLTALLGVALVLVGVALAAVAGRRRETVLEHESRNAPGMTSVMKGLLFAGISGLGSALVNFGLAFGSELAQVASQHGAQSIWAANAVWLPLMVAGGIPNLLYCVYLMRKNSTGAKFGAAGTGSYWLLAGLMAFFWYASTVMYGVAATQLGALGPVLGWPLFMSLIVIVATAWGVATGEWKRSGRGPLRMLGGAVAVLVLAIFVFALSSRMF